MGVWQCEKKQKTKTNDPKLLLRPLILQQVFPFPTKLLNFLHQRKCYTICPKLPTFPLQLTNYSLLSTHEPWLSPASSPHSGGAESWIHVHIWATSPWMGSPPPHHSPPISLCPILPLSLSQDSLFSLIFLLPTQARAAVDSTQRHGPRRDTDKALYSSGGGK